jgi:hypothetical protein
MAAVRPQIFPANHFLFSAGFVLFCRIFGRLATVGIAAMPVLPDSRVHRYFAQI